MSMDAEKIGLVDALPYIDQGYDEPGVREAAIAMVEEECRRYRPTKNYLDFLPSLNTGAQFETELMKNEFERLAGRLPLEPLSMKRYELPPPPSGKLGEVQAWNESVENSMAQLEHQGIRATNLELMLDYGCESWKANLEVFTAMQAKAQEQLQDLKKEIQDVNWARKEKQIKAGEKLKQLEQQWVQLVAKNYEIEQVCAKLEDDVFRQKPAEEPMDTAELPSEGAQEEVTEAPEEEEVEEEKKPEDALDHEGDPPLFENNQ